MRDAAESKILQDFGSKIRNLRQQAGLSQEELASRANVHRTYVGMVERGEKNATLITLLRIAAALEADVACLVEGLSDGQ